MVASGTVFDKVFVGPAVRHRQTMDAVASSYMRSEVPWPAPVLSEELAEHQGARVVERAIAAEKDGLWGRAYIDLRGISSGQLK
ncbi:MAG TPA: hypothetical protein EYN99_00305, partial [Gemmatimonadetes bacterium]|nr:hypothetical protein [Gemmatimonadota bacterium]